MLQLDAIQTYSAAWSATNEQDIHAALAECWTWFSTYTDPVTHTVVGPRGLAEVIVDFRRKFEGVRLVPTSVPDLHHRVGRFTWLMTLPAPVEVDGVRYGTRTEGFDFVEFSKDGSRLLRVVGFFGPLMPLMPREPVRLSEPVPA